MFTLVMDLPQETLTRLETLRKHLNAKNYLEVMGHALGVCEAVMLAKQRDQKVCIFENGRLIDIAAFVSDPNSPPGEFK